MLGRPDRCTYTLLIAAVALYFLAREWTALHAVLLNGLDVIRPQVPVLGVSAAVIVLLNIVLIRPLGIIGLPLGGAIGFAAVSVWYLPLLVERSITRLERSAADHHGAPR